MLLLFYAINFLYENIKKLLYLCIVSRAISDMGCEFTLYKLVVQPLLHMLVIVVESVQRNLNSCGDFSYFNGDNKTARNLRFSTLSTTIFIFKIAEFACKGYFQSSKYSHLHTAISDRGLVDQPIPFQRDSQINFKLYITFIKMSILF